MPETVFQTVYVAGLAAGSVIRAVYTRHYRKTRALLADNRKDALDVALLALASVGFILPVLAIASPWLAFADYARPAWLGWVGAAVFAAGLALLWRSHADLGGNWSPTLQVRHQHTLVTAGVYRHIRHPLYAAHVLWAIAQILLIPNYLAGPAMLATSLPLFVVRIPREERMMLDHFGEEYQAHIARTGRLIPRWER